MSYTDITCKDISEVISCTQWIDLKKGSKKYITPVMLQLQYTLIYIHNYDTLKRKANHYFPDL